MVIYDPQALLIGQTKELLRLNNPRQLSGDCLSLSDYFLSMEEQEFDVLPIQIVTVGNRPLKGLSICRKMAISAKLISVMVWLFRSPKLLLHIYTSSYAKNSVWIRDRGKGIHGDSQQFPASKNIKKYLHSFLQKKSWECS